MYYIVPKQLESFGVHFCGLEAILYFACKRTPGADGNLCKGLNLEYM